MKWLIYSELERSRKSAVLSVIFTVLAVGIFVLIALKPRKAADRSERELF